MTRICVPSSEVENVETETTGAGAAVIAAATLATGATEEEAEAEAVAGMVAAGVVSLLPPLRGKRTVLARLVVAFMDA